MKEISIIVPVYNVEKTVLACLKSIAAQTFPHFECICVDDGSTDSSAQIVEQFIATDARFKLVRQENKMIGAARNTGLAQAKGAWISFVDSDDYLHPQHLQILKTAAQATGAQIAASGVKKTPELYSPIDATIDKISYDAIKNPLDVYIRKKGIRTNVWAKLYQREVIGDLRFIEGIFYEDGPWTAEILSHCSCYVHVEAPLYYYYQNEGSIMRSDWTCKKSEDFVCMMRDTFERTQEQRPEKLNEIRRFLLTPYVKMLFNRIRKSSATTRPALWAHAKPLVKAMYQDGVISYRGLKFKHMLRLWWVLR